MIRPEPIDAAKRQRKPKPIFDFAIVAELSALNELLGLAFAETEEDLAQEAIEKVSRLFGARRFAVFSGRAPQQRMAISSGFKSREHALALLARCGGQPHQLALAFNEGTEEQDILFFEQSRPIDDRLRRLYNVFARRLEDRLSAFRLEACRRQAEEALKRSEARFQRALENIPDVVLIYDSLMRIQFINGSVTALTGCPTAKFLGKLNEEVWPADVCDACRPVLQKVFETGDPQSLDAELKMPGAKELSIRVTFVPLVGENNQVEEVVGILRNLTEQKARQYTVAES